MTLSITKLNITLLCRYAECHYAECDYAECRYAEGRYAECHYAECRVAIPHRSKLEFLHWQSPPPQSNICVQGCSLSKWSSFKVPALTVSSYPCLKYLTRMEVTHSGKYSSLLQY